MKNIFWMSSKGYMVERIPWYMGLSFRGGVAGYHVEITEFYSIIPLNLIIRGLIKLYKWIKFG